MGQPLVKGGHLMSCRNELWEPGTPSLLAAYTTPSPRVSNITNEETLRQIQFKVVTQMNSQIHKHFVQETELQTFTEFLNTQITP